MINRSEVILKSSRPATLSVVRFPTPICLSNKESYMYMVGDVLILYCIAEIIDEISTDPSKLEWNWNSTRKESTNNETQITSEIELVVKEKHNEWTFVCNLNVDNSENAENYFCKKLILVNINVTIVTSDNLQVGQSVVFQCTTGHDCQQCDNQQLQSTGQPLRASPQLDHH